MNAECCERIRDFLVPIYNLVLYLNDTATDEIDIHTVKRLSIISDEAIAALALRLPPMTFQAYLDDEPFGEPKPKWLGQTVFLDSKILNQPVEAIE